MNPIGTPFLTIPNPGIVYKPILDFKCLKQLMGPIAVQNAINMESKQP